MPKCLPCLPFLLPAAWGATIGIASIRDNLIILDFQHPTHRCGQPLSQHRKLCIPLPEVRAVNLQPDWLSSSLIFTVANPATLKTLANDRGQLQLHLSGQDQPLAEQWVTFLQKTLNLEAASLTDEIS
jgi:hypothetical protein